MKLLDAADFANYSFVDVGSGLFDATSTKRMIVLAPNGSGKTTLCTVLKEKYGNKVERLSFTGQLVDFKGAKNSFVIPAGDAEYKNALSRYEEVENTVGRKAVLGNLGLQETKMPPDCKARLAPIIKGTISTIAPLSPDQRNGLRSILANPEDVKRLIRDFGVLKTLSDDQAKSEATLLSLKDVGTAYSFFPIEEHVHDIERDGCPFCGAKTDDTLQRMREIRQRVTSDAVIIFRDYSFANEIKEKEELKNHIIALLDTIRSLSDDQIASLAITFGNQDKESGAQQLLNERAARKAAMANAEAAHNAFYEDMKAHLDDVRRAVKRYSPNASAELVPDEKSVKISLPRKYVTYSDGEKRDIYASIQLEVARSKAIKYLIVDDPFVSFDNANQHRTVYRLASYAHLVQQAGDQITIIIFTCDYSMLNIAHEQRKGLFSFAYLNSFWNNQRTTLNVELLPMPAETDEYPYIGYHSLLESASSDTLADRVAYAIERRAELMISKTSPQEKKGYNCLLHYDSSFQMEVRGQLTSNDELAAVIDGQLLQKEESFLELVRNNILYLASLRVWVEKKLYEFDQYRVQNNEQQILVTNDKPLYLHTKIIKCDETTSGTKISDFYPHWDKAVLMSLKTLLNENDHPYSMTDPFGYPMSISRQSLIDEVEEVKSIFSKTSMTADE